MPLRLIRRGRSPHYYLRGTVRGIRVFQTSGTDDPKVADDIRIKLEAELLHRSVFGAAATVTFAEAAASYLENGGEAIFLGRENPTTGGWSGLIGHFMSTPLQTIGQAEADEAARRLFPDVSAATRKRQAYGPLIAVLNHAAARGWVHAPKIHSPRVKTKPPKWATPEYVQSLLPHCGPQLRRFIVVIVYTGARLSEVLRLDWEMDVDLHTRLLTFRRTKNGKMRTAHIPDPLLGELAKVPEDQRRGPLFSWSHKSHVRRPLITAAKRAGLEYLSVHQLGRHTFATWLRIYAKRDLVGLQADGGWDSIASVARYAHVVPGETAKAVDLMPHVQTSASTDANSPKERKLKTKLKRRNRVGNG